MDFDFNLILVPVTLALFAIWLLDKFVFKLRENKGKENEPMFVTWAYDFWPILMFVMVMRSFIVEPFNIPSSSMEPSLYTGDYILVNKYEYGVKLPLVHTKVIPVSTPKRGDVVVFRYPVNPKLHYIKRVIGVPGDTVELKEEALFINGTKLETSIQQSTDTLDISLETNGGKSYTTQKHIGYVTPNLEWSIPQDGKVVTHKTFVYEKVPAEKAEQMVGKAWQVTVPEGQYFVMGDNRDKSLDGRFWGFVPEKNVSGRAFYVWMHKKPGFNMPSFATSRTIQ